MNFFTNEVLAYEASLPKRHLCVVFLANAERCEYREAAEILGGAPGMIMYRLAPAGRPTAQWTNLTGEQRLWSA